MKHTKHTVVKRGSTAFLKLAIAAIGIVVLLLTVFSLPEIYKGWNEEFPEIAELRLPFVLGTALTTLPFYLALLNGWKLLGLVDNNRAFSHASVTALRTIKRCALLIATIYTVMWPIMYGVAQSDDAPGVILIYGAIFVGSPLTIAVAVAVLERLLGDALKIKSENDLTV